MRFKEYRIRSTTTNEVLHKLTAVIRPFFKTCKNDKQNSDLFFNTEQAIQKRKTKFKSVFQSDAKTRNEIQIRFSKKCVNEKRNSYPVFQSDAKTKNERRSQIQFLKLAENEKQKAKFKSVFQCHAKTKNVNGT